MVTKLPIHILGTNHVSIQSVKDIENAYESFEPDIIAVELDQQRLQQLLHPPKDKGSIDLRLVRKLGIRGFLFAMGARYAQRKLGNKVGVKPGSEMLAAVKTARKHKKTLSLIDRSIDKTIRKLMKELTWKEKRRFAYDLLFGKYSKKLKVQLDISSVPPGELIDTLMEQVKDRYPTVYRVLVEERNHYMAKQLIVLHKRSPEQKILAVVGAGHKKEMEELLNVYNKKIEIAPKKLHKK